MKHKNCNEQLRVTPEGEKTSPTCKYSDARPRRVRKHIFGRRRKCELSEQNMKAVKNKKNVIFFIFWYTLYIIHMLFFMTSVWSFFFFFYVHGFSIILKSIQDKHAKVYISGFSRVRKMVAMRNQSEHIGMVCSLKCKKYYSSKNFNSYERTSKYC